LKKILCFALSIIIHLSTVLDRNRRVIADNVKMFRVKSRVNSCQQRVLCNTAIGVISYDGVQASHIRCSHRLSRTDRGGIPLALRDLHSSQHSPSLLGVRMSCDDIANSLLSCGIIDIGTAGCPHKVHVIFDHEHGRFPHKVDLSNKRTALDDGFEGTHGYANTTSKISSNVAHEVTQGHDANTCSDSRVSSESR